MMHFVSNITVIADIYKFLLVLSYFGLNISNATLSGWRFFSTRHFSGRTQRKIHDAAFIAPLRPLREMYLLSREQNDDIKILLAPLPQALPYQCGFVAGTIDNSRRYRSANAAINYKINIIHKIFIHHLGIGIVFYHFAGQ